jgi:hypothetical protein
MDGLTPDEINALCEIPEETYARYAMHASALLREHGTQHVTLAMIDREVLRRWYARETAPGDMDTTC